MTANKKTETASEKKLFADNQVENSLEELDISQKETTENADEKEDVIQKTAILQDELSVAKDKYVRLYAEFDNYRKRTDKEKINLIQRGNEELIKALLPIIDDFERAEKAIATEHEAIENQGFMLIQAKLLKILDTYHVKIIDAKKGSDFDAELHEAIAHTPTDNDKLKGKIIDIVEKGYTMYDKVIRHTKTVIGQ